MGIERPDASQTDFSDHISKYLEQLKGERDQLIKQVEELRKQLNAYWGNEGHSQ